MTDQNGLQRTSAAERTGDDMRTPLVLIVVQPRGVPGTVIIGRADSVDVTLDDMVITTDPDVAATRFGPGATYSVHFPDGVQVERGEDL